MVYPWQRVPPDTSIKIFHKKADRQGLSKSTSSEIARLELTDEANENLRKAVTAAASPEVTGKEQLKGKTLQQFGQQNMFPVLALF